MEFTLLWAALTAAVSLWAATRILAARGRLDRGPDRPADALLGAGAAGLFVGRVAAMIGDGVNPITSPADLVVVRAGVDTGFASLGALAALAWAFRDRIPAVADDLAPAALAGLAGWHGGCVWRGTCLGTVSDLPWAWAQTPGGVTRHPVELYAALGFLLAAVLVARLPRLPWLPAAAAIGLAGVVRLATQPIRPTITGGPIGWYGAAILVGATGSVWAVLTARRRAGRAAGA